MCLGKWHYKVGGLEMGIWGKLFVGSFFIFLFISAEDVPLAIYQAFDEHCRTIEGKLDDLKNAGFTHIQVSPIAHPNGPWDWEHSAWWMAYQPVKYAIGGRYGTEDDFGGLLGAANYRGLKIIVDVVFNQVGSIYDEVKGKRISREDWERSARGQDGEWNNYMGAVTNKYRVMINWMGRDWGFDRAEHFRSFFPDGSSAGWWVDCPSLNFHNPYVRDVQKRYLDLLVDKGVECFRFDAVEYFPEEAWYDFVHYLGSRLWGRGYSYAEYTGGAPHEQQRYLRDGAHAMDFPLWHTIKSAFSGDGWLSSLKMPQTNGDSNSVTFVETHDMMLDRAKQNTHGIKWVGNDDKDRVLALLYVIARRNGVPLVLNDLFYKDSDRISKALFFRKKIREHGGPVETIEDADWACSDAPGELNKNKDLLVFRIGNLGFMILNKSASFIDGWFRFSEPFGQMKGRTYRKIELGEGHGVTIDQENRTQSKIQIYGRDAVFYLLQEIY